MLTEHIQDSIQILAEWDARYMGQFAPVYHQLKNLTRAACVAAGIDFDAELEKASTQCAG